MCNHGGHSWPQIWQIFVRPRLKGKECEASDTTDVHPRKRWDIHGAKTIGKRLQAEAVKFKRALVQREQQTQEPEGKIQVDIFF